MADIAIRSSVGIVEDLDNTAEATNHTIDLSDAAVGDVRVVCIAFGPNGTGTLPSAPTITGWTEIHTSTSTGAASDTRLSSFYRVVQSGDTLTGATLSVTTDQLCMTASIAYTLENVDITQVLDQTSPTPVIGTHPINSPSITTQTNGAWVISAGIQDGVTGALDDGDAPTNYTLIGTIANATPSNGINIGVAYRAIATAGAEDPGAWQTNTGSEETASVTFAFRPVTSGISSVSPDEFDMDNADVDVNGEGFGATQGTGDVYISDADTLAGSANEVDITSAVNTWSDALINLDLTQLSAGELSSLQTLGPGTRYIIVVTDGSDEYGSPAITLHRPQGWVMSLGAGTPGATTARLTAPSGKTTADFDAGRFEEAANPATAVNITEDDYTEMVWSIEAKAAARTVSYRFRITKAGTVLDTYTVNPQAIVSAAAAYTLNAEAGSYSITGAAATVPAARAINAAAGSYSITGALAALLAGRAINAEAGSYSITGVAASLLRGLALNAEAGSYSITGALAALLASRAINAEAGSYSLVGSDATLSRGFSLNAEAGSYSIVGAAATLLADRVINAEAGSYSVVGALAAVLAGRAINAESGSYAITGADAALLRGFFINAAAGSYGITGAAAALLAERMLNAEPGSYLVSGEAITLLRDLIIDAASGSYSIVGADANLTLAGAVDLNAEAGSYSITGAQAALLRDLILNAEAGSYAITGADAELNRAFTLDAESGLYVLTGSDAALLRDAALNAEPGSYSIVGAAAELLKQRRSRELCNCRFS